MSENIARKQDTGVTGLTHRIVRVEVEIFQTNNGNTIIHNLLTFDGLNVRFNILKRRSVMQNKCDIAICNLNKEQVEYLTTINGWDTPEYLRKKLRVFAGYMDAVGKENIGMIFQGDIIRAMPTTEPDVWLECNCLSGYAEQLKTNTLSMHGNITIKDICTRAAKELGLNLVWKASGKNNKTVDGFYHADSVLSLIDEISKLGNVDVYEEDGDLVVTDSEIAKPVDEHSVRVFGETSGMISHPEPDPFGVKFKVLLDPSIKCGDPVQLQSNMIPAANGVYYVYSIRHFGELRGQAFYSEIEARSYNA